MDKILTIPKIVPRISCNNAQYIFYTVCALLRNVWGWEQAEITPKKDILVTVTLIRIRPALHGFRFDQQVFLLLFHPAR